jgi:hypothetical protein
VPSLIVFKSAAEAVPAETVTRTLAVKLTLSPESPSLENRVAASAAVPVIVVAAVAVTSPVVAALIVFRCAAE